MTVTTLRLILPGQPPSGKNQVKTALVRGRVIRFPNARFKAWRADAFVDLVARRRDVNAFAYAHWGTPLAVFVDYYPGDLRRRDVPGMMDALCHLLEYGEIVEDDALLRDWTWRTHALDRENPRLEVVLYGTAPATDAAGKAAGDRSVRNTQEKTSETN